MGNNISKVPEKFPWGKFFRGQNSKWPPKIYNLPVIVRGLMLTTSHSLSQLVFLYISAIYTIMINLSLVMSVLRGQKVTETRSTWVIFTYFPNPIKLHLILKEIEKYTQLNYL